MESKRVFFVAQISQGVSRDLQPTYVWVTLPETNSEFTPENGWLED